MVGIEEVLALVAVVAVHAVRIYHEVKLLALLMHHVKKLESVLMVDVVVACTVSQLQHDGFDRRFLDFARNDIRRSSQ